MFLVFFWFYKVLCNSLVRLLTHYPFSLRCFFHSFIRCLNNLSKENTWDHAGSPPAYLLEHWSRPCDVRTGLELYDSTPIFWAYTFLCFWGCLIFCCFWTASKKSHGHGHVHPEISLESCPAGAECWWLEIDLESSYSKLLFFSKIQQHKYIGDA